jgi:hypothetical protein
MSRPITPPELAIQGGAKFRWPMPGAQLRLRVASVRRSESCCQKRLCAQGNTDGTLVQGHHRPR